jgi:hypothetical protein
MSSSFPLSGFDSSGNGRGITTAHLASGILDADFNTLQVQNKDVATVDDVASIRDLLQNNIAGVNTTLVTSINQKLGLGGSQTFTNDIVAANDTYRFMGAKPSEIARLSGVTNDVQTQLTDTSNTTHEHQQ